MSPDVSSPAEARGGGVREQRRAGVLGSAPGCGAGVNAGAGRGLGARGREEH